jgi:NADH-quinone oxidoreductase subunit L
VGLVAGWRATLQRPIPVAAEAPVDTGLARVLYHKYYIDEIYNALIVRPLVWLSRVVLWKGVDQGVVDGAAVNGTARLSRGLGWLGSRLQTGQVGIYVVLFLVGALWILHSVVR